MQVPLQLTKSEISPNDHNIISVIFFSIVMHTFLATAQSTKRDAAAYNALINDVRILVDITCSMHRSGPANLRTSTLKLIVLQLPEKMQSGEWTFGQWTNILIPDKTVTVWKENQCS